MNDQIRKLARQRLADAGLTAAQLSRVLDVGEVTMSRTLNNTNGLGGKVPHTWEKLLDVLGLELTVIPKKSLAEVKEDVERIETKRKEVIQKELEVSRQKRAALDKLLTK